MGGHVTRLFGPSEAQRLALARLAPVLPPSAYLADGVAVALHCRHRSSIDLDLFTPDDPVATALPAIEHLDGVQITTRQARTIYFEIDDIPASVIAYSYPHLDPPTRLPDIAVPVASIADLISMKLAAIVDRGQRRDVWDLHAMLHQTSMSISSALELFRRRFPRHDIGHVLRALVYFADADAAPFPNGLSPDRWDAIKRDFEDRVRSFSRGD